MSPQGRQAGPEDAAWPSIITQHQAPWLLGAFGEDARCLRPWPAKSLKQPQLRKCFPRRPTSARKGWGREAEPGTPAWSLTWCRAPPGGHQPLDHGFPPAPSHIPSASGSPRTKGPTLTCSLPSPGAARGWQGVWIPGDFYMESAPSTWAPHPWPSDVCSIWGGRKGWRNHQKGRNPQVAERGSEPLLGPSITQISPLCGWGN